MFRPPNPGPGGSQQGPPPNPFGSPGQQFPVATQPSPLFGAPKTFETGFPFTPAAPATTGSVFGSAAVTQPQPAFDNATRPFGLSTTTPASTFTPAFGFGRGAPLPQTLTGPTDQNAQGGFGLQSLLFGAKQGTQPPMFGQSFKQTPGTTNIATTTQGTTSHFGGAVSPSSPLRNVIADASRGEKVETRPESLGIAGPHQPNLFGAGSGTPAVVFGSSSAFTQQSSFGGSQRSSGDSSSQGTTTAIGQAPKSGHVGLFGNVQGTEGNQATSLFAEQAQQQQQRQSNPFSNVQTGTKPSLTFGFGVPQQAPSKPNLFGSLQKTPAADPTAVSTFGTGGQQGPPAPPNVFGNQQRMHSPASAQQKAALLQTLFGKPSERRKTSGGSIQQKQPLLPQSPFENLEQTATGDGRASALEKTTSGGVGKVADTPLFGGPSTTGTFGGNPAALMAQSGAEKTDLAGSQTSWHVSANLAVQFQQTPGAAIGEPSTAEPAPDQREGATVAVDEELAVTPRRKQPLGASQRLFVRALSGGSTEKRKHSSSEPGTKVIATPEEISQLTTILCNGMPAELNDRETLLEHFGQFGTVVRVTTNARKGCATIRFEDHQSAELAKKRGGSISDRFPPLQIFWCSKRRLSGEGKSRHSVDAKPETQDSTSSDFMEPRILERPGTVAVPASQPPVLAECMSSAAPSMAAPAPAPAVTRRLKSQLGRVAALRKAKEVMCGARATKGKDADAGSKGPGEESLLPILKQSAHSVGERYKVLDARDKIIRLRSQRQSDLATARATRGSCPDMCPEKERYSRTDRKLLSSFEVLPGSDGVMDHTRMVKEYCRSSADQEEPLAHELRPPHVLRLTMDYLLACIMDPQGSPAPPVGEWYDFIWNRTRSIRKDITQQHLCEPTCVSLVEQCARFHIHCASFLCEEDMSVFDPKINNENLVKCLQTLKHLYYDLGLRGHRSPNEPEFRAYDVLLHLNEGDTVRQVQKLEDWVRRSPYVSLSVAAFGALNSGNYVRFFRLVGAAPYLCACLLHRYFGQVRLQAFHTLLKAFCQPNHREEFLLEALGRQLGFDSKVEVRDFARALGLKCSDDALLLDRSSQIQMESGGPPVCRSRRLVDAKRNCSVGEVVNGGPLPPDPLADYHPHESFSLDGMLRNTAYDAGDQAAKCWSRVSMEPEVEGRTDVAEPKVEIPSPEAAKPAPPPPATASHAIEAVKELARDLIDEAVQEHVESVGQAFFVDQVAHGVMAGLVAEETRKMVEESCREEYLNAEEQRLQEVLLAKQQAREAERRAHEARLRAEEDEKRALEALAQEVLEESLQDVVREVCSSCHREAQERLWDEQSRLLLDDLLLDVVENESRHIASWLHTEERALYDASMRLSQACRRRCLLQAFFRRWVEHCEAEKWQRLARETFPASPNLAFDLLDPALRLECKRPRLSFCHTSPDSVSRALDASLVLRILSEELEWAPLDLGRVWCPLDGHRGQFPPKLVVCLPCWESVRDDACAREAVARVRVKLGCLQELDDSNAKVETIQSPRGSAAPFCVTVVRGSLSSGGLDHAGRPRLLFGTSAVIFVAAGGSKGSMQPRLQELLQSCSRLCPVPCVCLLDLSGSTKEQTALRDSLELCRRKQLLPESWLLLSRSAGDLARTPGKVVQEAVKWCSEFRTTLPPLQTGYLKDFVEDGVTRMVFDVAYGDLPDLEGSWQLPRRLIDLYNDVLRHLAAVAASSSLSDLTVVAPEIEGNVYRSDWNDPSHLRLLHDSILGLCLPLLEGDPEEVSAVWDYLRLLCGRDCARGASVLLFASAERTLRCQTKGYCGRLLSPAVWVDVLHDCFCHLLRSTTFCDRLSGEELVVHYLSEELASFSLPSSWQDAVLYGSSSRPASAEPDTSAEVTESSAGEESMDTTGAALPGEVLTTPESRSLRDLEQLLSRQRAISCSFTSRLKDLLAHSTSPAEGTAVKVEEDDHDHRTDGAGSRSWSSCEDFEAVLAATEARIQSYRRSTSLLETLVVSALKS